MDSIERGDINKGDGIFRGDWNINDTIDNILGLERKITKEGGTKYGDEQEAGS